MKLGLTEKQYNHLFAVISEMDLSEQSEPPPSGPEAGTSGKQAGGQGYPQVGKWESGVTRGPANQVGVTKWADVVGAKLTRSKANQLKEQSSYEKGIWDRSTQTLNNLDKKYTPVIDFYKEHKHDINMVAMLGLGIFGGPVGLTIASGLGFLDAAQYFEDGDNKTGGMMLMFALIPGIGGVISKYVPGAKQLGPKLMAELGKKLSLGQKITNPVEIEVVKNIAKYRSLIEQEMKKVSKDLSIKAASQSVRQNLKKQAVKQKLKSTRNSLGKSIVGYGALGYGYNQGYDYIERKKEDENEQKLKQMLGIEN
jgi:hypothetical protein